MHNAGIFHHDAQRSRFLDATTDPFPQVAADDEGNLQVIVRVRFVPCPGGVRRRDEPEG